MDRGRVSCAGAGGDRPARGRADSGDLAGAGVQLQPGWGLLSVAVTWQRERGAAQETPRETRQSRTRQEAEAEPRCLLSWLIPSCRCLALISSPAGCGSAVPGLQEGHRPHEQGSPPSPPGTAHRCHGHRQPSRCACEGWAAILNTGAPLRRHPCGRLHRQTNPQTPLRLSAFLPGAGPKSDTVICASHLSPTACLFGPWEVIFSLRSSSAASSASVSLPPALLWLPALPCAEETRAPGPVASVPPPQLKGKAKEKYLELPPPPEPGTGGARRGTETWFLSSFLHGGSAHGEEGARPLTALALHQGPATRPKADLQVLQPWPSLPVGSTQHPPAPSTPLQPAPLARARVSPDSCSFGPNPGADCTPNTKARPPWPARAIHA
ncbi:uncharacterized protein LOC132248895 [Alligator mississippiensis]|uniref:uncharacterized protein LOC132248895 n=1 Tax=Alligator mississippiensis TaxID=8496 RepID=UPI002877A165|nr:uncharacterized protein LOC132248895 [Alligator mississippiensis]